MKMRLVLLFRLINFCSSKHMLCYSISKRIKQAFIGEPSKLISNRIQVSQIKEILISRINIKFHSHHASPNVTSKASQLSVKLIFYATNLILLEITGQEEENCMLTECI